MPGSRPGEKLRIALVDERGRPVRPEDVRFVVDGKVWPLEEADKPRRK